MLTLFYCLVAAALSIACAQRGTIYAVSLNGTTNEPNLLALDLDTYIIRAGPPLGGFEFLGQACAVDSSGSTFFVFGIDRSASGDEFALVGIDTLSGLVSLKSNTSTWPGVGVGRFFVTAIFPDNGSLLVIGHVLSESRNESLMFYRFTSEATQLGAITNASVADDFTFDAARSVLYAIVPGQNDDDSGTIETISFSPPAVPTVTASFPLENHYEFPQVVSGGKLLGLTLAVTPGGGYARNVTVLDVDSGAEEPIAQLGDFYVILEDGPKAIDPIGGRAFYMLATSPMGQFDVVEVDVQNGVIGESVGLCGFIGYCPESFSYLGK
jgi:hypothetical protein